MIETTLNGKTKDIVQDNIEQLKQLFPEIITEDKINFDKLKEVLGQEIDDTNEKYDFTWRGKHESVKISQTPSEGTLRPSKKDSKQWDTTKNLYIEGDNLEVLKLLQKSYYGKINCIYIDPPYNTGKDFIYEDDFKDNLRNYIKRDEEGFNVSSNPETSGRFHTNWLNMMYPRLKLARNLLDENGVIFISIDDNEVENLRRICDEIFGEINFITSIIWRKKTGASDSKDISTITEYALVYVKSTANINNIFTKNKNSYDPKRYKLKDEYFERRGPYYEDNLDRGGISYSDSLNYPIECPDGTITYPNGRLEFENDGWIWTWGKDKLKWGIKNGFITFKKSNKKKSGWGVYYKNYVNVNNKDEIQERAAPHKNLITDIINTEGSREIKKLFNNKEFNYPKPSNYIKLLCSFVKNRNIVLDFFSGSASTAEAIMKNNIENHENSKFIMVQIPEKNDKYDDKSKYENICEIGKERIRRAGDKLLEENPDANIDIGFKVFKLDSSSLTKWNPNVDNLEGSLVDASDNIVDGRSELDLVYEIMLKYGVELTESIEEISFDKYNFYSVDDGALVICLNNYVTRDIADDILKIKEDLSPDIIRVVFKDNGFESDSDKTNVKEILRNNGVDEFITI